MTDNDIIKALEYCEGVDGISYCNDCPLFGDDNCVHIIAMESRKLINRQKAEIERLMPFGCQVEVSKKIEKEIKSEAIKEFAERLKNEATVDDDSIWWIAGVDIDNLVKEMVGDTE